MICSCYGCTDRHPKCHSTCDKYKSFKEELEKQKAAVRPLKEAQTNMTAYKKEIYERYRRYRGRHKRT